LVALIFVALPYYLIVAAFARVTTRWQAIECLPGEIEILHAQSAGLLVQGQAQEADRLLGEAERLAREQLNASRSVLAELLYSRAMLGVFTGDHATSFALLEEAELHWREESPAESAQAAEIDFSLALAHQALGDLQSAELLYRRSARIARKLDEPGSRPAISSLLALAEIRKVIGDAEETELLNKQVLELLGDRPGADGKRALIALDKLIALNLERQDYMSTLPLLLRALRITQRDFPDDHPFLADRLDDLGQIYLSLGVPERSGPLFERAQQIRRRAFGFDNPLYTLGLCNQAELSAATGNHARSLDLLQKMSLVEDQFLGRAALGRSDRQLMAYIGTFYANLCKFFSVMTTHFTSAPFAVLAAFELVQRRKAVGIEVLNNHRRAMLEARSPRLIEGMERLTQLRWQIARLSQAAYSSNGSSWESGYKLEALRKEREELEVDLGRLLPLSTRNRSANSTAKLVSRHDVPDGAVLVEFLRFHVYRFDAVPAKAEKRWYRPRYLAFVLPSVLTQDLEMYDLGQAQRIDQLIARFRADVASDPRDSHRRDMATVDLRSTGSEAEDDRGAGEALYEALLGPLALCIGERKRLLIAPDGDLNRVPFEALPIGKGRRLIDEFQVSYVTVGRDLRQFASLPHGAPGPPLVLGDPISTVRRA
jgi:tetratricopeptide (TPR) repeat protein